MKMEINSCNTYSKIINIGCVNCIYNCHLKPHISQLMNKHTNICLNVILDHSRHLLNRLHDNSIDVCFSYLATNEISYKCIPYKTDEIIFVTNSQNIQFPMVFTTVKYFIYQLSILNLCRKVDLIGYTIFFLHTMYFNLQLV
ncbi:MAG: LysR substrate-binding domain-containing protein [Eubacteriales bacterium]